MSRNGNREELRELYRRDLSADKTFIPAKPKIKIYDEGRDFRVCAYCRVSTDNDEQLSSYELQKAHYEQLVDSHPNWKLVHIYADEGISGTSLRNRDDFMQMIADCRQGMYDLIITKSVSRFARNLLDCISIIRELRHLSPPVGVFFETDNINTLSEQSELLLSFLATLAQEESVKKSEAMNWSLEQRFKDGKLLTPAPLGYERPKDASGKYIKYAKLQVVEDEALIVRFIFDAFLAGRSTTEIAAILNDVGCLTKKGMTSWSDGAIYYILTNERYCGSVLTWKTFTSDMFEHKKKRNRHDRNQYFYQNVHEAVISQEKFRQVQELIESRRAFNLNVIYANTGIINEGVLSGFVIVNRRAPFDETEKILKAAAAAGRKQKVMKNEFSAFDLGGYRVVKEENLRGKPTLTIKNRRLFFSTACSKCLEGVEHVLMLLHPAKRVLALVPCEDDRFSLEPWSVKPGSGKRFECGAFYETLFTLMDWEEGSVIKASGSYAEKDGLKILQFELPPGGETGFGDEFYRYSVSNRHIASSKKLDWKFDAQKVAADEPGEVKIPSESELAVMVNELRTKAEGNG